MDLNEDRFCSCSKPEQPWTASAQTPEHLNQGSPEEKIEMPSGRCHDECFVYMWRQKAHLICAAYIFFHQKHLELCQEYWEVHGLPQPTYLALKTLYWESPPAAERGSAQHFRPAASLTEKRWLSKDIPSCDTQPATLVLSAQAIWQGNWTDIWKPDAKPEAPRALLLPPLLLLESRGTYKTDQAAKFG